MYVGLRGYIARSNIVGLYTGNTKLLLLSSLIFHWMAQLNCSLCVKLPGLLVTITNYAFYIQFIV